VPDREVRINHVFDAPREAVFEAWTDPDQVVLWWAPDGFHIPRESVVVEPRVGGRFHLDIVESSGTEWPMRAEILQISRMTITQGPYTDEVYEDAAAGWRSVIVNLEAPLREV
jgi:uncharacterized protein YndB with AHSA1/START domain